MANKRKKVPQTWHNAILPLDVKPIAKFFIAFLLMIALQASATGFGQKVTLRLKDANLEQVFEEVRRQTGLQFVFNSDIIQKTKSITVNIVNTEVGEALDLCFKNQSVTFEIISQTIIVKQKKENISAENKVVLPPASVVNGKVTDENGNPLVGATVMVKGSKNGTKTNENGGFSISAESDDFLVASYVGYEDFMVKVNKQTDLVVDESLIEKTDNFKIKQEEFFDNLDVTSQQIINILEEYVKPAVQSDGGNITFNSYDETSNVVKVTLQGACSGCPSSTFTLKNGIENMLRDMLKNNSIIVEAMNG